MRLPGFDVIFGLATATINILVEHAGVALLEIRDDEPRVWSFRANLDAGDDTLDAAPARGAVVKLLEAARLALLWCGRKARLRAGLETFDVALQCRGRRDAEDVIDPVGATPVENLGAAIMTIGAQQYLGLRPVGADGAQQAAQKGTYFLAAGPFGGAKHGGDEAAFAVEYDDRLKAVFIVMRIEQSQLLTAMDRVEGVIDVERDAFGNLVKGLAIKIDHGAAHAQQRASIGQVFQSRDGRLRTQLAIGRRSIERYLEHGIVAKTGGVVAVFITRRDHQQSKANNVGKAVRDLVRRTRVFDAGGHAIGDAKALLDLAQHQDAAVRRQQTGVEFG